MSNYLSRSLFWGDEEKRGRVNVCDENRYPICADRHRKYCENMHLSSQRSARDEDRLDIDKYPRKNC